MKIAMVSEHASPLAVLGGVDAGGQNVHVDALSRALAARGHEVVVHTRRDDPQLPDTVVLAPRLTVHHVDAGPARHIPKDALGPYLPQFAAELTRFWNDWRPDVIHAHFWMSGVVSLQGADRLGVPTAITFHALGTVKRRHQGDADTSPLTRIPAEKQLLRRVDRIIATCTDEVNELVAMEGDPEKMDIVPCGVDCSTFTPTQARTNGTTRRVLSLSRLVPRKGVGEAVEMLAHLPGVELVIAGGPQADRISHDPEAMRLMAVAREAGVADRVRMIGAVDRERIPALVAAVDLAVCLPWYEPFGIVPLEIMACGRPVVGSAVGGLLDTIVPGENGLLVPPQRPDLAARAVRQLLEDSRGRERMGRLARQRVESRYDWPRVAEATEAVYQSMTSRSDGLVLSRTAG